MKGFEIKNTVDNKKFLTKENKLSQVLNFQAHNKTLFKGKVSKKSPSTHPYYQVPKQCF